ncbi:MAG: FHA domain-containing protein [Magnetococcales bacterium]|nr:FHA domain-containing protein [Magnetococcales bacterium]
MITARFLLLENGVVRKTIPLDGRVMHIGRDRDCEIPINYNSLSRFHAQVVLREDGNFVIRDLDSKNGTRVNDRPVREHFLQEGDRVQLGKYTLLFRLESPNG